MWYVGMFEIMSHLASWSAKKVPMSLHYGLGLVWQASPITRKEVSGDMTIRDFF